MLSTVAITCFAIASAEPAVAKGGTQNVAVWKLEQSHFTLGPIEVLMGKDALKVTLRNNGAVVLAKAPLWDVVVYRPSTHLIYFNPHKDFMISGLRFVPVPYIPGNNFHRVSDERVHGETVVEYAEHADKGRDFRYWVIQPVDVSPQACEIYGKALRVPVMHAIALNLQGIEPGHDDYRSKETITWHLGASERVPGGRTKTWRVQTISWSKTTVPQSEFACPTGYHKVDDEQTVFVSNKTRQVLEDLLAAPDSDKDSDKEPKPKRPSR